jgi:hypothetical protein
VAAHRASWQISFVFLASRVRFEKLRHLKFGVFQQYRLLTAVSRIAAIQSNDLAPTNMNGPKETFIATSITVLRWL